MMERRHIQFGLAATCVAMDAMQGRCTDALRLQLVLAALEFAADDSQAVEAVKAFVADSKADAGAAGEQLRFFVTWWRRDPDAPVSIRDAWMRRADIHG